MQLTELRGFNSYRALQAFHSLMLGLKMLPAYKLESYEEFYSRVKDLPAADQEKMIREAALFVKLDLEEIQALICFVKDANGVPYGPANVNNLTPDQFIDVIVLVCLEISKIKIDFVTEAEKKN